MKNNNFREIQVSSSLLVVIFLGVLALGVFIFLLGVSVGKKQVRLSAPTQVVTQQIPDPVKEAPVKLCCLQAICRLDISLYFYLGGSSCSFVGQVDIHYAIA
ncbi:MAG: hypothetical protein HGA94_02790, partial [Candidatus Aminicenantes bacterium]|nr:hypothetical protein [Candidatus Aminicenantes bacterium]